jgi:hypothetical protein
VLTDEDKQWIGQAIEVRMQSMEERLSEQMQDMQTELLKAFLPAQEQNHVRDNALESRANGVELRVAIVEARLAQIEKKLLLNPPAA